jgi:hypothetical protein
MTFATFTCVATILRPYILAIAASGTPRFSPNGTISPDVRLAGGSFYDIMTRTYGIGHTDTVNSCWYVVDAVNEHPDFGIQYPNNHVAQHSIAAGLQRVSGANFQCCAGVIVGILIWIYRPSQKDCNDCWVRCREILLWTKEEIWTELPSRLQRAQLHFEHINHVSRIHP